ncbi:unnamed protein product [Lymnaea stagnalis]|uniref:Uncharacterized protein n=1 Tax=Lymnaea stagnalis TaxID=6523 RepID=A0AAV2I7R9_LYMST
MSSQFIKSLRASWQVITVFLTLVVLCPLIFPYSERSQESKCVYVILLMTIFWITEAFPLPVTSLIPLALCPLLGIAPSSKLVRVFLEDVSFLLIGGLFVAIAIEECKLHKRFALRILMFIGVKPRRLLLGIMVTTAFLSMWISNTAATAMMMPITRSLLTKLFITSSQMSKSRDAHPRQTDGDGKKKKTCFNFLLNISVFINVYSISEDESIEMNSLKDFNKYAEETAIVFSAVDVHLVGQPHHHSPADHSHWGDYKHHEPRDQSGAEKVMGSPQSQEDSKLQPLLEPAAVQEIVSIEDEEEILKNLDSTNMATLKTFSMSVCYSANIGGIATLTGTAANMVLGRMVGDLSTEPVITFASWFAFGFPTALLILLACYFWMNITAFGLRSTLKCSSQASKEEVTQAMKTIQEEYHNLGKIKFNEAIVLAHFCVLVVLWLLRVPGSFPGWATLFKPGYVSDGSTALLAATSLFVFPSQRPNVFFFRAAGDKSPARSMPSILSWKQTMKKFPWGVIFLIGGGFSLSEAMKVSGLSTVISNNLMFIKFMPLWVASLLIITLTSAATQVASNTVVTMLVLPMLKDIASSMQVHPLYLMLPATVSSSLAFMLPVATAPNALVFGYGDVRVVDMIKCGMMLNILGIIVVTLGINTWGYALFNMGSLPSWATSSLSNTTFPWNSTIAPGMLTLMNSSASSTTSI